MEKQNQPASGTLPVSPAKGAGGGNPPEAAGSSVSSAPQPVRDGEKTARVYSDPSRSSRLPFSVSPPVTPGALRDALGQLMHLYGDGEGTDRSRRSFGSGFCSLSLLGRSFLDCEIPLLRIGGGEKAILYVGGHHGMETVTSAVLLRFAFELCEAAAAGRRVYNVSPEYLLRHRSIYILPLLNPDGAMIAAGGLSPAHPLYERILKMNGGKTDFSHWQANGRGVDLNHNYNAGFEEYKQLEVRAGIFGGAPTKYSGDYPESEPETAALCSFLRGTLPRCTLTLHTQGEEIYYSSCGKVPLRGASYAKTAARLTGYRLAVPEGGAAYGGLTDWIIGELSLPSLTLECGKGENPLPPESLTGIYGRLRELLFTAPILFCS